MSMRIWIVLFASRARGRALVLSLALALAVGVVGAFAEETPKPPPSETPAQAAPEAPAPPARSADPADPFELRPARKQAPPAAEALPPVGITGVAADPGTPGAPAAAESAPGAHAAPAAPGDPAAPPAPEAPLDPRAARKIKIDDLPIDPAEHGLRPAPIDTSIVLNLKRMENEPERRWSLRFAVGSGDVDLGPSIARAHLMERFGRQTFGEVADLIGEIFDFGWSDDGPTEPSTAARIAGNVRYKILPIVTLEAQAGRSNALTHFTQPGFRFDERNEVIDFSAGPIVTLPFRLWRFGFYAGGGAGILRGKLSSEVFVPAFGGQPVYLVSEATGNSTQYYLRAGGEAFVTKFASFTIEAEYRNAKIDNLKYTDETIGSTTSARAVNETDTPLVWTDYVFDFQNQIFGWVGDPNQPVEMDFTGVSVTAGLRYHW